MADYRIIGISLVVLALMFMAVGCASNTSPIVTPPGGSVSSGSTQPAKLKLSDTKNWQYAHLISGDTLDSAAQAAMAGFSMDKQVLSDGTTQITLKSTNAGYKDQTYNLKQGQQLYFIERTMGDDPQDQDFNLGDDTAVVVDSAGYIVQ
jgi:hypothetical protein